MSASVCGVADWRRRRIRIILYPLPHGQGSSTTLCTGAYAPSVALHGRQKLPFTCSYLPGKSNFNITFLLFSLLIFTVIIGAANQERDSFDYWPGYVAIVGLLLAFAICARWSTAPR